MQNTIKDNIVIDYEITTTPAGKNSKGVDMISCHIPQFDLYYSAKDEQSVKHKGAIMVKLWLDFVHKYAKEEKCTK